MADNTPHAARDSSFGLRARSREKRLAAVESVCSLRGGFFVPPLVNVFLFWDVPQPSAGRPRLEWAGRAIAALILLIAITLFCLKLKSSSRRFAMLGFFLGAIVICAVRWVTVPDH